MCVSLTLVLSNHTDSSIAVVTGSTCWLGGRDSNPDSQIQSLESYHWTTSQQRIRIYGTRCGKSTFVCVRTTSNYWPDKKIMIALLAGSKDNTQALRHPLARRFFRLV